MTSFLKKIVLLFIPVAMLLSVALPADAYVSVKGYTRKDGTYVRPHVRSEPNGLKYDNYSWKPSQGLYNPTYGTKGSSWNTPTWVTDPDYYEGKRLYETGQSGNSGSSAPEPTQKKKVIAPVNGYAYGSAWYCNSGYLKVDNTCQKVIAPVNGYVYGTSWNCDDGYFKSGDSCQKVIAPANAYVFGSTWHCNVGYALNPDRTGCYSTASNNSTCSAAFANSVWNGTWQQNKLICGCQSGHKWNAAGTACVLNVPELAPVVKQPLQTCPANARLYTGNVCICDGGYSMRDGVCVHYLNW